MTDKPDKDEGHTAILNTAYDPPDSHYVIDRARDLATKETKPGRRPAADHAPVPKTRKAQAEQATALDLQMSNEEPYRTIQEVRDYVLEWKENGYPGASPGSRELLNYWGQRTQTGHQAYWAQLEALRTIIWLREAGEHHRPDAHAHIMKRLTHINDDRNEGIERLATKMATGTGKTRVMQMLITWLAVTSDKPLDVVVVAPNLTVMDRLKQDLIPNQKTGYRDIVPNRLRELVGRTQVTVLNWQAIAKQDTSGVESGKNMSGVAKALINHGSKQHAKKWQETDEQMIARVFRKHGDRELVVINDECHHCYTTKAKTTRASKKGQRPKEPKLTDMEKQDEKFAVKWFRAIQLLRNAKRLREPVYDFSATPIYVRTPGDLANPIFPWTISDYPLIDAVEAGLTKIPQVPTVDKSKRDDPMLRRLYDEVFKGVKEEDRNLDRAELDAKLEWALQTMYDDYIDMERKEWQNDTPPVMIIATGTIEHAQAIHDWIAGYEDENGNWQDGNLPKFQKTGPDQTEPTLLVHSSKALDEKKRDREIFQSIGKKGEPGANVRCVISVSMLTEGWDALTVTHIVGFRAFGTQLLCEQVVGRGLRRSHFDRDQNTGRFLEERVAVIGVPFNFMHMTGRTKRTGTRTSYLVEALPKRSSMEITFPHVHRYQVTMPGERLELDPKLTNPYTPAETDLPEETMLEDITGGSHVITNRTASYTQAVMILAKRVIDRLRPTQEGDDRLIRGGRLMLSAHRAVEDWINDRTVGLSKKDRKQPNNLLTDREVPMQIARACKRLRPEEAILPVYADEATPGAERYGSTANVRFPSGCPIYHDTRRSHVNRAPCDSKPEAVLAAILDSEPGIRHWARNAGLGLQIPYTDITGGGWRYYEPDFIGVLARPHPDGGEIHLILEYKGVMDPDSEKKIRTTEEWWLPAVNGDRRDDRPFYAFAVLENPETIEHDLQQAIENSIAQARADTEGGE